MNEEMVKDVAEVAEVAKDSGNSVGALTIGACAFALAGVYFVATKVGAGAKKAYATGKKYFQEKKEAKEAENSNVIHITDLEDDSEE